MFINFEDDVSYFKGEKSGLSPLLSENNIPFNVVCSSCFDLGPDKGYSEEVLDSVLIVVGQHDALFTLEQLKEEVPKVDNDVMCRDYLNPKKYELVFLVDAKNPSDWIGFIAIESKESITVDNYELYIGFELIYIKPKFRREGYSGVFAFDTGRVIGCQAVYNEKKINERTCAYEVVIKGEGATEGGRQALSMLAHGVNFHFSGHYVSDADFSNDKPLPGEVILLDEH